MRQAFDIHNQIGNFCGENIYQEQLLRRCLKIGLRCEKEVCVKISFKGFFKTYFIDLLVENCCIYEAKTVKALN